MSQKKGYPRVTSEIFLKKADALKVVSLETVRKNNIKTNVDLITLIKALKSQGIVSNMNKLYKVIIEIAEHYGIPYIKQEESIDNFVLYNSKNLYNVDFEKKTPSGVKQGTVFGHKKQLERFILPFFEEANKDFNFSKLAAVIYEFDHLTKTIKVLIASPSSDTVESILKWKEESTLLKEKQTVYYDKINENGEKETVGEERSFDDYRLLPILAPFDYIQNIIYRSQDVTDSLNKTTTKLREFQEQEGLKGKKQETDIYTIKGSLLDLEGTLDGIIYTIFKKQFEADVSDIHIEPLLDSVDEDLQNAGFLRYRIDGTLQGRVEVIKKDPKTGKAYKELVPQITQMYEEIIARLKEKSGIAENKDGDALPGDGKLKIYVEEENTLLEYRVSTIPEGGMGQGGKDKMVLRKLQRGTENLDLEKMNMDPDKKAIIDEYVGTRETSGRFNNGLILMTGPTGSGKSTTLFSILNQINKPGVNIQTLEDPIEYVIPGINQSQIKDSSTNDPDSPTYTYHKGMKACLRQDPDIILIGEIRDEVTMDIAKEAADTGHLVFSSLHTNDTYKTLDRLAGIGFDMKLVGNIIRLIIAQRLGKLVCPRCIKEYNDPIFSMTPEDAATREKEYLNRKMDIVRKLLDSPYVMDLPNKVEDIKLYQGIPGGTCIECGGAATKGRCGIYEFLPTSNVDVTKFILEYGTAVDNETIKNELFIPQNITTLHQNALWKTFNGIHTHDGKVRYIAYEDALSGAGADSYGWDKDYLNFSLEELNLALKQKKAERKIHDNLEKIEFYKLQIVTITKNINTANKDKIEAQVKEIEADINKIKEQNKKLQEIINKIKGA